MPPLGSGPFTQLFCCQALRSNWTSSIRILPASVPHVPSMFSDNDINWRNPSRYLKHPSRTVFKLMMLTVNVDDFCLMFDRSNVGYTGQLHLLHQHNIYHWSYCRQRQNATNISVSLSIYGQKFPCCLLDPANPTCITSNVFHPKHFVHALHIL